MRWLRFERTGDGFGAVGNSVLAIVATLGLFGCGTPRLPVRETGATAESRRVLVVYNAESRDGSELADYYADKRHIPSRNLLRIDCPDAEDVSEETFEDSILGPIQSTLRSNPEIDFVVLTKGVPIRLKVANQYSVDAWIAAGTLPITAIDKPGETALAKSRNPYFGSRERFSSAKFGFHLVTRLDGYTLADCKRLVDDALAAKPEAGPFLFDEADNRRSGDYGAIQAGLERAAEALRKGGRQVVLDQSPEFMHPDQPLAGYASWGSNDAAFTRDAYRDLRFKPGAICETFVSTSGRTFRPTTGGQSLIADLIASGVTGVKGYVSEPFTFALAKPEILFDRYTRGFNLAESFYAASQVLKWKDVVIGDPLCAPYAR